jgi:hypothetical protein
VLRVSSIPVFYNAARALSGAIAGIVALGCLSVVPDQQVMAAETVIIAPLKPVSATPEHNIPAVQGQSTSQKGESSVPSSLAPAAPRTITLDHPMRFRLMHTRQGQSDEPLWIAAEGLITAETAEEFKRFIRRHQLQGAPLTVRLHSGGGHLLAGLELGRLIRGLGYQTEIGRSVGLNKDGFKRKGRCASSCAYAFLGGQTRKASEQELGIHRYGFRERETGRMISRTAIEASSRQIIDALLYSYLNDMDIHEGFLARAMADTLRNHVLF